MNGELYLFSLGEYQSIYNGFCRRELNHRYGRFNSLDTAMDACSADKTCTAIFDNDCDKKGTFNLCKSIIVTERKYYKHCIYKKDQNHGM